MIKQVDGKTIKEVHPGKSQLQVLTLSAQPAIQSVELHLNKAEGLLFRVCCQTVVVPPVEKECTRLDRLPANISGKSSFEFEGFEFTSLNTQHIFNRVDFVDTNQNPDRAGNDGLFELALPPGGVSIKLPALCSQLEIHVMLTGRRVLEFTAFDRDGNQVGSVRSANLRNIGQMLTLSTHCLLYTSPSPRDATLSRMPSSA